ncbi:MAG TPA: replicative DNA helicase [Ktedonobacterales bacterium]|jgi:replicative DNA helicase|nr:replicative DNA helicase [Ktedonobacterales bacterium]
MAMAMEKLLPQNVEAEAGVLGSLLIDPDAMAQIADFLHADDFYREAHRVIYQAISDLYENGSPADLITLTDELGRRGKLEEVGGASYVSSLANQVPTSANIDSYAHIVERTAVLRRLIHAAGQIAGIAYNEPDANVALDQAEKLIFNVSQRISHAEFEHIRDTLMAYLDKLGQLHSRKGDIVGVATGFSDLDKMTGGLQRSDLIILAARPAVGKTALALSVAHNAALRFKHGIAIFSLEMSAEQLIARLLSMDAGVDQQKLRTGFIDDDEWERISQSVGNLSEANIYIDDTPGITLMEMRSKARRLMMERGFDLIVVDYLQLMQGTVSASGRSNENRVQEISAISRGLKELARELDVPVLALSQLSRAVESRTDKKPQLSDLRESGCLTGDTPVYLPDEGVYQPIKSLVGREGVRALAINPETWKLEPATITNAFATGHKPILRLTTRLGRSVRATANHKFLTVSGWRRLDELVAGDRIAAPRTLTGPTKATMTGEELALLGHMIGDGCALPRHTIQYTSADITLAEEVARLAKVVFGDAISPRVSQERSWYQVYLSSAERLTRGKRNPLAAWLDDLGVFGLRSYEKHIPEKVFAQPASGIARFLRHLWSTDGCVHLGAGANRTPRIYYASSSERLSRDVQSLLLRLGINARIARVPQQAKGRDQFHVIVSGKPDVEAFIAHIGGLGVSKARHEATISRELVVSAANTNRDVIPHTVWQAHALPALRASGLTHREFQAALGQEYCGSKLYQQNMSRERAMRVATITRSSELTQLAGSDIYWDEIISIEPDGEDDVYDLTVEGRHNFVAANITVHNSIEQDADIVMFIYRDDVYNPESDRKNIADIIIAKHRNGPVGMVSLYFQGAQTRYRDLELRQIEPDY